MEVKYWERPSLPKTRMPVWDSIAPLQARLLTTCLRPLADQACPSRSYFFGEGVGIYWKGEPDSPDGWLTPDWFFAMEVPALVDGKPRQCYSRWHEGVAPVLVAQFVRGDGSDELDDTPNTGMRWIHERWIHSSSYVIFDRERSSLVAFELDWNRYRVKAPNAFGHLEIGSLGVALGVWHGEWDGYVLPWLRLFTLDGQLIRVPEELEDKPLCLITQGSSRREIGMR